MAPPSKYTAETDDKVLNLFKQGKSIACICSTIGISRKTFYQWCKENPHFDEIVDRGMQISQAYWEHLGEAGARGEVERFSAVTWIFTMKSRFRADYQEAPRDNKAEASEVLIDKILDKLAE